MDSLLYEPTLKDKAEQHRGTTKRQYLGGEDYIDIRIITLRSHYIDEIYDIAFKAANGSMKDVHNIAKSLMNTGTLKVREFVEVKDNKITVALNVDKIDEAAEDKALLLLIEVDKIVDGVLQRFGEPITFNNVNI